jgi:hypothetical protein
MQNNSKLMIIAIWRSIRELLIDSVPSLVNVLYSELAQHSCRPDPILMAPLDRINYLCREQFQGQVDNIRVCISILSGQGHRPQPATIRSVMMELVGACFSHARNRMLARSESTCPDALQAP